MIVIKILLMLMSVVLIVSVLLQESKSDGLSGVIGGGAEQLFGKKKSSGYNDKLSAITKISSVITFGLIVAMMLIRG